MKAKLKLLSLLLCLSCLSAFAAQSVNLGATSFISAENFYLSFDYSGYASSIIKEYDEKKVITSKTELINAINYNITNLNQNFSINFKDIKPEELPNHIYQFEKYFVEELQYQIDEGNAFSKLVVSVKYNDAAKVLQYYKNDMPIKPSDTKAIQIKNAIDGVIKKNMDKTDYEKILNVHDFLVKDTEYDYGNNDPITAYDALINKAADSEGLSEALQLMYSILGIENRVIYAITYNEDSMGLKYVGTQVFIKVKMNDVWYNIHPSLNVRMQFRNASDEEKKHAMKNYFMVNDTISKQRYRWDDKRYPESKGGDPYWFSKNNLIVNNQEEFEAQIKKAIENKQAFLQFWVKDYDMPNKSYSIEFKNQYKNADIQISLILGAGDVFDTPFTVLIKYLDS